MKINFTVYGEPVGKQRPRLGKGTTYTPKKTKDYMAKVEEVAMEAMQKADELMTEDAVYQRIRAIYPIPKSWSNVKKRKAVMGKVQATVKPDYDNVEKIISDSVTGIVIKDDKQITQSYFVKTYGIEPCVEVEIGTID